MKVEKWLKAIKRWLERGEGLTEEEKQCLRDLKESIRKTMREERGLEIGHIEVAGIGGVRTVFHPEARDELGAVVVYDLEGRVIDSEVNVGGRKIPKTERDQFVQAIPSGYRQKRGHRQPTGQSQKTRKRRLELAAKYYETCQEYEAKGLRPPTQKEFCEEYGISVSTLQRALREAHETDQC